MAQEISLDQIASLFGNPPKVVDVQAKELVEEHISPQTNPTLVEEKPVEANPAVPQIYSDPLQDDYRICMNNAMGSTVWPKLESDKQRDITNYIQLIDR